MFKFFKLPGPKELGRSKDNALPSRFFHNQGDYTWEDYDKEIAQKFPIRSFILVSIPRLFRKIIGYRLKAFYWYLLHNYHPKHQYHLLDLRQTKNEDTYYYGWAPPNTRMLYAIFNILREYVENTCCKNYKICNIIKDDDIKNQYLDYLEACTILHWWDVDRIKDLKTRDDLYLNLHTLRQEGKKDEVEHAYKQVHDLEQKIETDTEAMTIRVMKIRNKLWL